jgi:protein tyrosine phosphatase
MNFRLIGIRSQYLIELKLKCHRYWTDSDSYCFYKNYYVTLTAKPIELDGCIIRQLKIRYTTDPTPTNSRPTSKLVSQSASSLTVNNHQHNSDLFTEYEFMQFHLVNWPDHGVPDNIESIISILSIVRQKMVENNRLANESLNKLNPSKSNAKKCQLPLSSDFLLVHCSAGCGRTGTIIAIDQIWNLINENVRVNKLLFIFLEIDFVMVYKLKKKYYIHIFKEAQLVVFVVRDSAGFERTTNCHDSNFGIIFSVQIIIILINF